MSILCSDSMPREQDKNQRGLGVHEGEDVEQGLIRGLVFVHVSGCDESQSLGDMVELALNGMCLFDYFIEKRQSIVERRVLEQANLALLRMNSDNVQLASLGNWVIKAVAVSVW